MHPRFRVVYSRVVSFHLSTSFTHIIVNGKFAFDLYLKAFIISKWNQGKQSERSSKWKSSERLWNHKELSIPLRNNRWWTFCLITEVTKEQHGFGWEYIHNIHIWKWKHNLLCCCNMFSLESFRKCLVGYTHTGNEGNLRSSAQQ